MTPGGAAAYLRRVEISRRNKAFGWLLMGLILLAIVATALTY